ncbi:MAG: ribosomal protein S18-alanine N-acetyltransferase [Elusimicrobia bacterium]|nr:ribosomal protein S18-alanine N-acetyltransferase [Elusimicrobiota bacterium]
MLKIEAQHKTTPHWTREQFVQEIGSPHARLWVAESQSEIKGYVGGWLVASEAQITTLAVEAACLRQGIGEQLLRRAIHEMEKLDVSSVTLEVGRHNGSALQLYQKLGFKIVGSRPNFYNGNEDALLMELSFK